MIKLPPERDLAAQMNVGRPTVRAALRALASMNVIDIRPGSGAYVTSLEPESLVEHIDLIFYLDPTLIDQYYQARRALELATVELAAQFITGDELLQLEECLAAMIEADKDGRSDDGFAYDSEFHKLIADASRNPLLSRFTRIIHGIGQGYRREIMTMRGSITTPAEDHQEILNALREGNVAAAREAMAVHLTHSEAGHRALVESQQKNG